MTSYPARLGRTVIGFLICAGLIGCGASPDAPTANRATTQPAASSSHRQPPLELGKSTVVTHDVRYAATPGVDPYFQSLDIYAPRDGKAMPVVLFLHGGGWTRGDRKEVGAQPRLFNDNGIVLVSVDYRLSPAAVHPAHVDDVASAIAWVHANIAKYGGDPDRIIVMGHSAGSHLAALVATDPGPLERAGLKLSNLAGAISLDGSAFDIPDRILKGGEKLAQNCVRAFGPDPAVQADASPINHIHKDAGIPPFLLIYVREGSLNHIQSQATCERLLAVGNRAEMRHVEGKTHASLHHDLGTDNNPAGPLIVQFVRSVTPPGGGDGQ